MSIHPSLSGSSKDQKTRSVLKRAERLKILMEKGEWKEGQTIFGLPKLKILRMIKIKKEKAAPAEAEGAAAEGAAAAEPAAEKKEATPATKASKEPKESAKPKSKPKP